MIVFVCVRYGAVWCNVFPVYANFPSVFILIFSHFLFCDFRVCQIYLIGSNYFGQADLFFLHSSVSTVIPF